MRMTEVAFRDMRNKAAEFAAARHAGQTYGGDKPYTFHLRMVADNALKWGTLYLPYGAPLEAVVIAAWLHDVIEDCGVTREEVAELFGEDVAEIVWCVTNEPGKNRKERHLATYPKIRNGSHSTLAVFVKLMDRISNLEAGGKTGMYFKEHQEFKAALYREGEFDPLWAHLDNLITKKDA